MRPLSATTINQLYYTYTLGSSLYIPLTCRCNSLTLPETRGPNFVLPRPVVASLLYAREMELNRSCGKDDIQERLDSILALEQGPQKLPSLLDANKVLEYPAADDDARPRISDLLAEVQNQIHIKDNSSDDETQAIKSIVFAGEGEPTLRFQDLLSLSEQLTSSSWFPQGTPIRLTTNGLVPSLSKNEEKNAAQLLQLHGVSHVSVALLSADPVQYDQWMQPLVQNYNNAHAHVCQFIEQAVDTNGLQVEVTAVDRPGVDKGQLEALVRSLSVTNPVRWRPYFG